MMRHTQKLRSDWSIYQIESEQLDWKSIFGPNLDAENVEGSDDQQSRCVGYEHSHLYIPAGLWASQSL
jgi:hypothetical protein